MHSCTKNTLPHPHEFIRAYFIQINLFQKVKGEKVTSLPWEKLSSRIISKMSNGYSLSIKGYPPSVNKGKLEMIEMSIASRSGNKKVTLVHNLDIFKIDLQEFAHKCQVGVAASSSIHDAPNKKRPGIINASKSKLSVNCNFHHNLDWILNFWGGGTVVVTKISEQNHIFKH